MCFSADQLAVLLWMLNTVALTVRTVYSFAAAVGASNNHVDVADEPSLWIGVIMRECCRDNKTDEGRTVGKTNNR